MKKIMFLSIFLGINSVFNPYARAMNYLRPFMPTFSLPLKASTSATVFNPFKTRYLQVKHAVLAHLTRPIDQVTFDAYCNPQLSIEERWVHKALKTPYRLDYYSGMPHRTLIEQINKIEQSIKDKTIVIKRAAHISDVQRQLLTVPETARYVIFIHGTRHKSVLLFKINNNGTKVAFCIDNAPIIDPETGNPYNAGSLAPFKTKSRQIEDILVSYISLGLQNDMNCSLYALECARVLKDFLENTDESAEFDATCKNGNDALCANNMKNAQSYYTQATYILEYALKSRLPFYDPITQEKKTVPQLRTFFQAKRWEIGSESLKNKCGVQDEQ